MTDLARIRMVWSGTGVVGGGVSTFYCSSSTVAPTLSALSTLMNSTLGSLPPAVNLNIQTSGEILNDVSGAVVGAWSETPAIATKVGSAPPSYAAGVGARIIWNSADVYRRRRVRGSTYIVPFSTNQYSTDGTIADSWISAFNTALGVYVNALAPNIFIWSRPTSATANDGKAHPITAATVAVKVSWLRTRRT